jgi:hypothetical protein
LTLTWTIRGLSDVRTFFSPNQDAMIPRKESWHPKNCVREWSRSQYKRWGMSHSLDSKIFGLQRPGMTEGDRNWISRPLNK